MSSAPASSEPAQSPGAAVVRVKPGAAERLRRGALTLRRDDLLALPADLVPGRAVLLCDERDRSLGSGLVAAPGPTPLAVRLFDRGGALLDDALLLSRLQQAADLRRALMNPAAAPAAEAAGPTAPPRDAYRLVHGEADGLPGLFIDRYGDAAVMQTATAAMDARKGQIAALLQQHFGVTWVVCRDDGSARDVEGLPRQRGLLCDARPKSASATARAVTHPGLPTLATLATFHDAGSRMQADLFSDRKTGSFLDQQENHGLAATYAARLFPRRAAAATALDTFTYHGGFALALARAGLRVTACDEDPDAIARARHNAALNQVSVDFRVENAFDLLRRLEAQGARFDVVVVDPPALAKRGRDRRAPGSTAGKRSPEGGSRPTGLGSASQSHGSDENAPWARAYRELNLRAMRLLSRGGLLVSCSCSGRVSPSLFGDLLHASAVDARRSLQLLERRGAGPDHPVLLGWPESEYLKCWFLRALD